MFQSASTLGAYEDYWILQSLTRLHAVSWGISVFIYIWLVCHFFNYSIAVCVRHLVALCVTFRTEIDKKADASPIADEHRLPDINYYSAPHVAFRKGDCVSERKPRVLICLLAAARPQNPAKRAVCWVEVRELFRRVQSNAYWQKINF